jgi:hypothetical protein
VKISIALSLALAASASTQIPARAQTASMDLLRRATNPNPTLNSYTATAQLSAILHVAIPIHKSFTGTVYYLRPKRKIAFQNVSGSLSKFQNLVSSTPTYDQAVAEYTITPLTDNGTASTYSLVPKSTGSRVKSVTVSVNDQSALLTHAQWAYTNGGSLSFDQAYSNVGSYRLASTANIAARFPGYSVDGTITFSNYKPNAPVSPSVF